MEDKNNKPHYAPNYLKEAYVVDHSLPLSPVAERLRKRAAMIRQAREANQAYQDAVDSVNKEPAGE